MTLQACVTAVIVAPPDSWFLATLYSKWKFVARLSSGSITAAPARALFRPPRQDSSRGDVLGLAADRPAPACLAEHPRRDGISLPAGRRRHVLARTRGPPPSARRLRTPRCATHDSDGFDLAPGASFYRRVSGQDQHHKEVTNAIPRRRRLPLPASRLRMRGDGNRERTPGSPVPAESDLLLRADDGESRLIRVRRSAELGTACPYTETKIRPGSLSSNASPSVDSG
ncbi:hypothetical protein MYCOZU1_03382 [Mycobacterium intracellulare subsp. chimaera]|uniref:Uncharacterized protein n=1 Tax=Mycobacterium intracellulare subsp. chimaera TaxID=222805 RepID=A0A220YDL4_MYCIT|nr:hypothetical protein MYCOZU2_03278 [Mycobacterium intracellulare subsp. chimaera]ASL21786.1 hypothetical protein MYCOZU1_03382 [Mycobacterium intracellulare subsp. chimaera]